MEGDGVIPLVDLRAQVRSIRPELDEALGRVLDEGSYVLGRDVEEFELEFASYCDAAHAVGLDSGVSALELGMRALGIGPGDEVIVPANSFIASSSAVSFTGATPVLVDVDPRTYNLDPRQVERAVTPRTKAVMVVHLYGNPADLDRIASLARERGLLVVEDACQAHGARYHGRRVGSFGQVAAFSFYPAKNLGAFGDGGALLTGDRDVADTVRMMRNYGQTEKYHHQVLAWNRRLDTIQAAVLRVKLRHLDRWNARRRRLAELYASLLPVEQVTVPSPAADDEPVFHVYPIEANDRDGLRQFLRSQGIETGIHYPIPMHLQPASAALGYGPGAFPVSEAAAKRLVSLPMFPELAEDSVEYVAKAVAAYVESR